MRFRDAVRAWRDTPVLKVSADPSDVESVTLRYLMYVLVPAWFVPGVADWVMHRKTRMERTSGLRESLVHALMMGEISVPVTLVLLCEVNPALLCLHWEQVANRGGWLSPPRLRRRRLPAAYLAAVFGGMAGLIGLPYAEEAWRCARALRTLGLGDADV